MTPEKAVLIVFVIGLLTVLGWQVFRPLWRGFRRGYADAARDAGLSVMVEDRTEDQPVATIDEALAQTTDQAQRDALLDVRLRAMGGAE